MDQQTTLNNKIRASRFSAVTIAQNLMLLYLTVWSISPPLDVDAIFRVLALGCAVGWFLLDMVNGLRLDRMQMLALAFMLLVVAIALIEFRGDFSMLMKPILYYMLVLAYIINYSYRERFGQLRFFVPVFIVLVIIFNVLTIRALLTDGSLARKIIRADESIYPYMRQGVGGYTLIYTQVLAFPLMVTWVIRAFRSSVAHFVLGCVWLLTYVFLIMKAGYSIAVISTLISLFILFFYRKKSVIPAMLIAFALIVGIVLLIGYVDIFRLNLLKIFDGTTVAKKINDIYVSIHGESTAVSISARIVRYRSSIRVIFHYPFIGGLWMESGGGHSALMDCFAKYGIWGGMMFVCMFYCVPFQIKEKAHNDRDIQIANALLVSLILVSLLDAIPYEMMFPVILVLPVMFYDIQKWRNDYEGSLDRQPAAD